MRFLPHILMICLIAGTFSARAETSLSVVVSDNEGFSLAQEIVEGAFSRKSSLSIAFGSVTIKDADFYFHENFRLGNHAENTLGGRMARALRIELNSEADAIQLKADLLNLPEIEYVDFDRPVTPFSPEDCSADQSAVRDLSTNDKLYPQAMIRSAEAHQLAEGHSLIAMIDFGIEQNHPSLRDFDLASGTTYTGGSFHQNLAVDFSGRTGDCDNPADCPNHPYGFGAVFGWADEYNQFAFNDSNNDFPSWSNCDEIGEGGDGDGAIQREYVGHGTHVAGLLAGSPTQLTSGQWRGACEDCSLLVIGSTKNNLNPCRGALGNVQPHTDPFLPAREIEIESSGWDGYHAIALAVDLGAQVINLSGGDPGFPHWSCSFPAQPHNPSCMAIEFAYNRDVLLVAAVGNSNAGNAGGEGHGIHFPASEPWVVGVAGVDSTGARWISSQNCGSNYVLDPNKAFKGPDFAAPALHVYSTMYRNTNYNPRFCHTFNDGDFSNGFGFCSGTSMSAPLVAGVLGLVRSVNPIASRDDVIEATRLATDLGQLGQKSLELGWGVPHADQAVEAMLGISSGSQLQNRLMPFFDLYSSTTTDALSTTKPQFAVHLAENTMVNYISDMSAPEVRGYDFSYTPNDVGVIEARAEVFLFSTHVSPDPSLSLVPLYRMREDQGLNDRDTVIVTHSELGTFAANGYELEGLEGYIFEIPGEGSPPPGTVGLYRASKTMDHIVYPDSKRLIVQNRGYNVTGEVLLGYVYPNHNSDADELIDGQEYLLGTDPADPDSNCDGVLDHEHYPVAGVPSSDPMAASSCTADLSVLTLYFSGFVGAQLSNLGPSTSDQALLELTFENSDDSVSWHVEEHDAPGCVLTSTSNACPVATAGICEVTYECSSDSSLSLGESYDAFFTVYSDSEPIVDNIELTAVGLPTGSVQDPDMSNNTATEHFSTSPCSDPMAGPGCTADLRVSTIYFSGFVGAQLSNLGPSTAGQGLLDLTFTNSENLVLWHVEENDAPGCVLTSASNACPMGSAGICEVTYECSPDSSLGLGESYEAFFTVHSNHAVQHSNIEFHAVGSPIGNIQDPDMSNNMDFEKFSSSSP